jgi:hypothetical protein
VLVAEKGGFFMNLFEGGTMSSKHARLQPAHYEEGLCSTGSLKVCLAALGLALLLCPASQAQQKLHYGTGDNAPPAVEGYPVLPIGSHAPDFSLPGVDGKTHSLKDYDSSKFLAIIFNCNHCPVAQRYETRI